MYFLLATFFNFYLPIDPLYCLPVWHTVDRFSLLLNHPCSWSLRNHSNGLLQKSRKWDFSNFFLNGTKRENFLFIHSSQNHLAFPIDLQQKSDLELPPMSSPECLVEAVKSLEGVRSLPTSFNFLLFPTRFIILI